MHSVSCRTLSWHLRVIMVNIFLLVAALPISEQYFDVTTMEKIIDSSVSNRSTLIDPLLKNRDIFHTTSVSISIEPRHYRETTTYHIYDLSTAVMDALLIAKAGTLQLVLAMPQMGHATAELVKAG